MVADFSPFGIVIANSPAIIVGFLISFTGVITVNSLQIYTAVILNFLYQLICGINTHSLSEYRIRKQWQQIYLHRHTVLNSYKMPMQVYKLSV